MRAKIKTFFSIPPAILREFWTTSYQRNRVSLLVICAMIFCMELFNMARVLFWSRSGLGTLNNRIYFGMYLSLFAAAVLCLVLDYTIPKTRLRFHLAVQYASVWFFLLWHVCINCYDLWRGLGTGVGLYYTAVLGLSVFILMPAKLACAMHLTAYVLLMALAGSTLRGGDVINLTCTAIVALAISLTTSYHNATILSQRLEIHKMNDQLRLLAQHDGLTGLLNHSAFQHYAEPHLTVPGTVLLVIDLDNFKEVNDRYGHPCGDFVLKEAAFRIAEAFPSALATSHIGGDEFAVLLSGDKEFHTNLNTTIEAFNRSILHITWHGKEVGTGCSVGGCCIGNSPVAYDTLYTTADQALYQAKGQGKGRFQFVQLP